jgi:hypothetical protein
MNVKRELNRISKLKNFPSEKNIKFYENHAAEHGFSVRNGFIGKILSIPRRERINLRFVRGSRFPFQTMPMNNLKLLHKHRNFFMDKSNIHQAFINRTTGSSSKNKHIEMIAQIPNAERNRFIAIAGLQVQATQLPIENLRLLNKHRALLPNGDYIHNVYTRRMKPVLNRVKLNEERKAISAFRNQSTSVNRHQIRTESKSAHSKNKPLTVVQKNATRLNITMPHFNAALSSKRINNENVQEVIGILKAYRQTKRPRENNAPERPTKPTTTSLNNLKRYKKEIANYNSVVRNWMKMMAKEWKRNNP